jgi:hypothetical protein
MHKFFGEWYRIAGIVPNDDLLRKRWQGIENFLESINLSAVLNLVRLFYARQLKDASFIEIFRQSFQEADAAFPMRGNDLELGILAGSIIGHFIENNISELSDAYALAILCANFRGTGPYVAAIPELLSIAQNYLAKRSAQLRSYSHMTKIKIQNMDIDNLIADVKQNSEGGNLQALSPHLVNTLNEITGAIDRVAESVEKILNLIGLQQEETNILWWLLGEYSRDLNRKMADIGLPAACLVAGKELADLTIILPGPLSAEAFLDKTLRDVEQDLRDLLTLKEAVNMSPINWRSNWLAALKCTELIQDLCPVLLAVIKSTETEGEDEWFPIFEKAAKFTGEYVISPLNLSMQVYQENLLCRIVANISEQERL